MIQYYCSMPDESIFIAGLNPPATQCIFGNVLYRIMPELRSRHGKSNNKLAGDNQFFRSSGLAPLNRGGANTGKSFHLTICPK